METLLYLYLGSGILLSVLAIPLILRRIPPNPLYGFRVQQTLENKELWYKMNVYSGKRLLAVGLVTVITAVGLYYWPGLSLDEYALGCMGVSIGVLLLGLIQSYLYMKSLSDE